MCWPLKRYINHAEIYDAVLRATEPNFVWFFTQYDLHMKQTLVLYFFQQLTNILDMLSAWKMITYHCPRWQTQKRMLATKSFALDTLYLLEENVFSRCTITKKYFCTSTVQNECFLLCLNGMSKTAIPKSNTVHSQCTGLGALKHRSAMLLVFQCISAPNTNNMCTWCTLKYC